jgi:parvulin-like peptidyl-prolyl isomerase
MRVSIRSGLVTLLAVGLVPLAGARAQAPPAKAAAPPAAKGAAPPATKGAAPPAANAVVPTRPPNFDQVVATVNGDKITRGDVLVFLSRYQIPPIGPEQIYRDAVESLVNTRLIGQFLNRQRLTVPEEKIKEAISQLERNFKTEGSDLLTALQENGQTMDDLRREVTDRLRWIEYVNLKGTEAELKKYAANHKDLINGTQIKASHIFLNVPPEAAPAEKEKLRQKLLTIKQDIDAKKITFAEAANKNSEDPANAEGAGGDIGYFGLNSGIVEEFAKAAFALKPGQVSDPVESGHGYHLIQVTDRKEGNPVDFEQQKPFILQVYSAELQKQILTAERKNAKIDIKPMPPDLFPPTPPQTTPAPGTTSPDAAKGTTPK